MCASHSHLNHQHPLRVIPGFRTEMLYLMVVIIPQVVKPQTVMLLVHYRKQLGLKHAALRRVQHALEYGILHALPIVHALLCDLPQAPFTCRIGRIYVVCDYY